MNSSDQQALFLREAPRGKAHRRPRNVSGTFTTTETFMNEVIKGRWKQLAGNLKSKWGKLTDDDLKMAEGDSECLGGRIQEHYGVARDEARKQVKEFGRSL